MRRAQAVALLLLLAHAGCGGSSPSAPTGSRPGPTAGDTYLRAMIALMQENSVNRLRIDWTTFQNQVLAKTPNVTKIADTYPAIQLALSLLNDHHSYYVMADNVGTIGNPTFPSGCGLALADDLDVPQDIGYVRVPSFGGSGGNVFAQNLQAAIRARDRDDLVGWIVDLRGNGGGNMWPMLAGVGPVLGTGTAGYFVPPVGPRTEFSYASGSALLNGQYVVGVTPYSLRRENPRVAVLTDKRVASSGEAIAVAFRARPGARTFGTATCGVPTSNSGFQLDDGAFLQLTTGLDADRQGTVYDAPLQPDETIQDPSALAARAIAWLRGS